jgi:hypothetical protein
MCEFKSRVINGIDDLIDTYFSGTSVSDRLMNATVKIIINQNADKFDGVIELFADKDGMIDADLMLREYSKAFGSDKMILDLRDFVDNDMIKSILPNKAIAIRIDDLAKILE